MNEPTSKKILFNKSSLLSLKAELLKKQEEVKEKKLLPHHKVDCFKPQPKRSEKKDTASEKESKKSFKERLTAVDTEELEACRKSKSALEKKAELYDHLADGAGDSQLAGRFLVDFKEKKQQETHILDRPDSPVEDDIASQVDDENDGEWIEFSDCLGRTRKCLKSDLEFYKKRDKELMKLMSKEESTSEEIITEKPLLVQKTNDYLQTLREKWEEKERELLAKDSDIHYQDLLFDEARIHGVGYYAFSTDETERRKQMQELLKAREETLNAQKAAEEAKKKRDELVAARVAAARARQRARAGLPPEDPNDNQKDFTACLMEFLTQQKNEADSKAKEKEKKLKEEQEKERQKLREAYVREWDIGKEGVDDKPKKFREITQEEYVEQQRSKRIKEFAPLQSSNDERGSNSTFDNSGRIIQNDDNIATPAKSWSDVRSKPRTPPPPMIGDVTELEPTKGLYFSSKKSETVVKYRNFVQHQELAPMENELSNYEHTHDERKVGDKRKLTSNHINSSRKSQTVVKYRNFVQHQEPTPIENELSNDEDTDSERKVADKRKLTSNHTEIAPPPTYEYYGPTPKQMRTEKPFDSDIREAYAQGAKSLKTKSSNRQLSKNYDFTLIDD